MVGQKTLLCSAWLCAVWIAAGRAGAAPGDPAEPGDDLRDVDLGDATPPGQAAPEAPAPVAAPPVAAAPVAAPPDAAPRRFLVTGSLIERATRITPSPVTILGRDQLLAIGHSMLGDTLQPQPEQGNAINAGFNNGGDGSSRINLRSLDVRRTLVLLDGRRFVPVGLGGDTSVDLDAIPLAVIDRVEILKDGGSAIYGSEAMGGVVNLLTRRDLEGTEMAFYTGQSAHSDGFTFDASFVTGQRFARGRGHVLLSAGTQFQDAVSAGSREFSRTVSSFDYRSGRTIQAGSPATPNGRINASQIDLNGDGSPDPVNLCGNTQLNPYCTVDGMGGFRPFKSPDDLFNFQPDNHLYTPSARANAYAAGRFQIARGLEGFLDASFLHRVSQQQLAPEPFDAALFGIPISRLSIYNPIGGDVRDYRRRLVELGDRQFEQSIDTLRTVIGVRGAIPDDAPVAHRWEWELSYNFGLTDATQRTRGDINLNRMASALGPSFLDASGRPACGTSVANQIPGCVPIDLLSGAGSVSAAARDYVRVSGLQSGDDEQQMAVATAHGPIARLPGGGEIALALVADVRRETANVTPDPLAASGETTIVAAAPLHGTAQVAEAAAELSIVPIRDRDGVERIEIDASARAFHHDTAGDGVATTARALVRPIRGLALRASRSNTFRLPSVAELFEDNTDEIAFASDPCDASFGPLDPATAAECAREGVPPNSTFNEVQRASVGGNLHVAPETAQTTSFGAVLELLRGGLSVSVDWWQIELTQAIQRPAVEAVFAGCYQRGDRALCDLVHRNPALGGAIDFVDLTSRNLGGTSTSGVDIAANLEHHVARAGDLHARLGLQVLRTFDLDDGATVHHGAGNFDLGAMPVRRLLASAEWRSRRGLSAGFNFQFIDSFIECASSNCNDPANGSRTIDSYSKLDVFGSIALGHALGDTVITVGVNNVLDRAPPATFNTTSGNYDAATYDLLGRFTYLRATQAF